MFLDLADALLDGLADAIPLRFGVEVDSGLHDDDFNFGLHILVIINELLKALLVELDVALDDCLHLAVHDALVRLADDGDEEVERHKNEEEVE